MSALRACFSLFFPCACVVCGKRLKGERLCGRCFPPRDRTLDARCRSCGVGVGPKCGACEAFPLPVRGVGALWLYRDQRARDLVRTMKYGPSRLVASRTGALLGRELGTLFPGARWDLVAPVPSRRSSLLIRGFNQCAVIADAVSHVIDVPHCADLLKQRTRSKRQSHRTEAERLTFPKDAFTVSSSVSIEGRALLLVDDVLTTGATANAAAIALLGAGAASVDVAVLALSERSGEHRATLWKRFGRP